MTTQASRPIALKLLSAALLLAALSPARAANLIVNTLSDTATVADGLCTLREAITNANGDGDTTGGDCSASGPYGADTITFGVSGTITLFGTLAASDVDELTLDGAGQKVTLSGNHAVRVLTMDQGAALKLQRLTIANSKAPSPFEEGGGVFADFDSRLTVSDCTFTGDSAGLDGGAIYHEGDSGVFTSRLIVSNNTVTANGAASGTAVFNLAGTAGGGEQQHHRRQQLVQRRSC